ncbi:Coiled-coil domain-containing protein 86 [Aphelenchoides besseyi]|nr:Coiled-coil domain-containing protein 86 [Aphelenchoides besseyi]
MSVETDDQTWEMVEMPVEAEEPMDTTVVGKSKSGETRGLAKSGRWWKKVQQAPKSAIVKVKPLHTKWDTKMKKKAEQQNVKARQAEIREGLAAERQEKLQRRKEQEERRKKNIEKNEIVQVIKNTEKLKRLNKKQMRMIKKMDTTELLKKMN